MDELERKKILTTIKTCRAYMRKASQGIYSLYGYDWRVAKMDADIEVLGEIIEEVEQGK